MSRISFHSINHVMVLRVLGWLLLIESAFMVLPLLTSLYYEELAPSIAFGISTAATLVTGCLMTLGFKPFSQNATMRKREGLLLTTSIWIIFSIFGMLPYMLTGMSLTDSFFETISGFTTTGASVIDVDSTYRGILMWRALTQWIGGLGIILFTLAVLPMLNYKGGIALFNAEMTGITHERLRPRVSQTAKDLWMVYVVLTVLMVAMLAYPMGWFDAVCCSLTTVSTGGFSTRSEGFMYWHSTYIYAVVVLFMFLGGINFAMIYNVVRGKFKRLLNSDVFKWYSFIAFGVALIVMVTHKTTDAGNSLYKRFIYSLYDTVSALSSTGATLVNNGERGDFLLTLLMLLMFFGGMAGSTSGGAKLDRLIVMLKNMKNELYRVLHPNAVTAVRIDGKSMSHLITSKIIAFLSIYMLVMLVVAIILSFMGMGLTESVFTSLSAISSVGITADNISFAALDDVAKWLLSFEMLVGRLELFTVLVIFTRSFWIKD